MIQSTTSGAKHGGGIVMAWACMLSMERFPWCLMTMQLFGEQGYLFNYRITEHLQVAKPQFHDVKWFNANIFIQVLKTAVLFTVIY